MLIMRYTLASFYLTFRLYHMSEEQRAALKSLLWNIANDLRGKMNADEFRDYILGFIFYKYLSEKINLHADKILAADNLHYADLLPNTDSNDLTAEDTEEIINEVRKDCIDALGYFLRPEELFHNLAVYAQTHFILDKLSIILKNIENSTLGTDSHDDFNNLFEDLDLASSKLGRTSEDKNQLIAKILSHLDKIDFQLADSNADILGDAYEYLIGEFASNAGKKAGEFYTPQSVSSLLAQLVTLTNPRIHSAYDPTCGSGSLLLRVKRHANNPNLKIYGQELNRTTYNLARMNMILHDVKYYDFDIKQEDTLERPQHRGKTFDVVVANPPFSAKWSASPLFLQDGRFVQYGRLAPSSKADFAFVLHMLSQLAEDGTMAVILPHGVLFRGAAEGVIRKHLLQEKNYLDAVIGLPANVFYGTTIPTCVLVLKKCRKDSQHVVFIDASQDFEKVKTQNHLLPQHIDKIIHAYQARQNIDKYCQVVAMETIAENDYNLNIPRYVDTFEAEADIDLADIARQLQQLAQEEQPIDTQIADFCTALGIANPFQGGKA